MRICVCFKVIPDLEKVIPQDWAEFSETPDTSYTGNILGCFDETALETALRFKDEDSSIYCTAVTLGFLPQGIAKKLYAAGFDELVCLSCERAEFEPEKTAAILARFISGQKPDLILAGTRTAMNDSGCVPLLLAAKLGIPAVTNTLDCRLNRNSLFVTQETDSGFCDLEVRLPVLLTAGNNPSIPALRMATLSAQMTAAKRTVLTEPVKSFSVQRYDFLPRKPSICRLVTDFGEGVKIIAAAIQAAHHE